MLRDTLYFVPIFFSLMFAKGIHSLNISLQKATSITLEDLQNIPFADCSRISGWGLTVRTTVYNETYLNDLKRQLQAETLETSVAISSEWIGCYECKPRCTTKFQGNLWEYKILPYLKDIGCPVVESMLDFNQKGNYTFHPWENPIFDAEFKRVQTSLPNSGCPLLAIPGPEPETQPHKRNHTSRIRSRFLDCYVSQFFGAFAGHDIMITINSSLVAVLQNETKIEVFHIQYFPLTRYGNLYYRITWEPENIISINKHGGWSIGYCANEAMVENKLGTSVFVKITVEKLKPSKSTSDRVENDSPVSTTIYQNVRIYGYGWRYLKTSTYDDFRVCWYLLGINTGGLDWFDDALMETTFYCTIMTARERSNNCHDWNGVYLSHAPTEFVSMTSNSLLLMLIVAITLI